MAAMKVTMGIEMHCKRRYFCIYRKSKERRIPDGEIRMNMMSFLRRRMQAIVFCDIRLSQLGSIDGGRFAMEVRALRNAKFSFARYGAVLLRFSERLLMWTEVDRRRNVGDMRVTGRTRISVISKTWRYGGMIVASSRI